MSVNAATLSIAIEVDDKGSIKVKQLGQAAEDAGRKGRQSFGSMGRTLESFNRKASGAVSGLKRMASSVTSLKGLLGAGLTFLGLEAVGSQFLDAASSAEEYRIRLNNLLGSVEEGNKLFSLMSDYAGSVPFEYREIMASATQLAGVLDGGAEGVAAWMPLIGDLAAVSGLSITEATDQVTRMLSAGAASADLFRERGVLAMLGFQAGVTYSAEETRTALIRAWEDPASKFRDATQDLSTGWKGIMSMFSDMWFGFRNMVMDSGLFEFLKKGFTAILDRVRVLKDEGKLLDVARALSDGVIAGIIHMVEALEIASNWWNGLKAVAYGALMYISKGIAWAYETMRPFMKGLDMLYDGLVRLKMLDVNPFDMMIEGARDLETWSAQALDATVGDMMQVHASYQSVVAELEGWRAGLGKVADAQGDATMSVSQAEQHLKAMAGTSLEAAAGAEVLGTALDDALAGGGEAMADLTSATEDLVAAEEDAAGRVQSAWQAAMAAKAGEAAAESPAAASASASGMPLFAAVAMPGQVTNNYTTYNQVDAAMEAERQAAEAAARAAEESRRQWQTVADSYSSLLESLRPFTSDLSLAEVQGGFKAALRSVEAAEDFLDHLQYHASRLQGYESGFESLLERVQGNITSRERADWGATDWWGEYDRLAAELADLNSASEDYNERALELSESMLDALNSIDQAEAEAAQELNSLRSSLLGVMGTADAAITSLLGSDLNPAQSMEFYADTYARLFQRATTTLDASDVQDFVQFAQQAYLPFLQEYGGNYVGIFDSVIEDIEAVKDAAGVDLLEGGIVGDLETIQSAVDALGLSAETSAVFAEWLAERLDSGQGLTGSMFGASAGADALGNSLSGTEVPMHNVTTALEALADVTEDNLTTVADQLTELVEGIAAAIEALEENSGTPIVVTPGGGGGGTQPTKLFDYAWRFVLEGHTPITGTGFTTYWGYWTTPHGGHVSDRWTIPGGTSSKPSGGYAYYAAEGGFATDRTLAGEDGDEWIVPVDKGKNRDFLADIGLDDERLARAMAKALGPMLRGGGGGGDVVLKVDGRELARVMASQLSHNRDLVEAVRRVNN